MTSLEAIELYTYMIGFGAIIGIFWALIFTFPKWD